MVKEKKPLKIEREAGIQDQNLRNLWLLAGPSLPLSATQKRISASLWILWGTEILLGFVG